MTDFEKLYQTYFTDVFRYIRRLSGNDHIAEEITSETFFKAMRTIDKFRGDCDVRVWLCQIAKNCFFSYQKKTSRTESIENKDSLDFPASVYTIEEQFVRHDEAMQIQKLLHNIPEQYKEVFMWRVFAELSFKQIGQIFGKSENWACVTYYRARQTIKNKLEDNKYDK